MADLSITKPAAAQRQIDAAIRMLFLHGEDFVAIHTVAAAARTILNDLAEARGVGETDNTRFVVEFMYRNNYGLDPTDPAVEAQIKYTADAIELWGNLNLDISSEMFVYCFWWNSVNALKPENVVDTASGPVHLFTFDQKLALGRDLLKFVYRVKGRSTDHFRDDTAHGLGPIRMYPGADEAEARGKELDLDDPRLFGDVPDAEAADNVINLNKDTK